MIEKLLDNRWIFALLNAIVGAIIWEIFRYCKRFVWDKRLIRNEMEAVLNEANKQANQGRHEIAIKEYDKLLENIKKRDYPDLYSFAQRGKGMCYLGLARKYKQEQEYNLAIQYVKDAVEEFKKKKRIYQSGQFIDEFKYPPEIVKTYFTLGSAYEGVSDIREKENNLLEAISYYKQALDICELYEANEALPEMFYKSFNNIGICYGKLAEIKEVKLNLERAIEYFDKALEICKKSNETNSYNQILIQKGNCYLGLSRQTSKLENNIKAIEIYSDALKSMETQMDIGKGVSPAYTGVHIGLGNSYQYLANYPSQDIQSCIEKAINHFDEALKYIPGKEINKTLEIINNKALAYKTLAKTIEPDKNLNESKALYEKLLKTYKIVDYPYQYAQTITNLALVHGDLANYHSQVDLKECHLRRSIEYFEEVINKLYSKEKFPSRYLDICNHIATAYINLADTTVQKEHVLTSIEYSEMVLHDTNHSIFQHAKALLNLGIGNAILYQMEKNETNKTIAENYFKEVMRLLNNEKDENYYQAESNLSKLSKYM